LAKIGKPFTDRCAEPGFQLVIESGRQYWRELWRKFVRHRMDHARQFAHRLRVHLLHQALPAKDYRAWTQAQLYGNSLIGLPIQKHLHYLLLLPRQL
jgi:hypothetical protein